jgi:hypothetical protein
VLSRKRQQRITRLIHQLADYPHRRGDYQTRDSTDRTLKNIQLQGHLFTYWADGPAKELRIVEL